MSSKKIGMLFTFLDSALLPQLSNGLFGEGGDGMSRELKPCPFRIHGERTASLTVAGEFFYNETFMPCMGKECACFTEDSVDAYCDRNGAFMLMTKEATE